MKKVITSIFVLIILITVGVVIFITSIILEQYDDTKQWQSSSLSGDMNTIPPELAKNYVRAGDNETATIWEEVDATLKEINQEGMISDENIDDYKALCALSIEKQEEYEITSGQVVDNNTQLSLYLDIVSAIKTAYTNPNIEDLSAVTDRLHQFMFNNNDTVNRIFLDQLQEIATDYEHVYDFIDQTLPNLGSINNKVLSVDVDVDSKTTEQVINEIEQYDLSKFPLIKRLHTLLTNDSWSVILNRNEITKQYNLWQTQKDILENLSQSDYYVVSSITTYEQAQKYDMIIKVTEKDGYTIDPDSKIKSISYNGQVLSNNQYIRKGTQVVAQIEPNYIKDPVVEEVIPIEEDVVPNTEEPETETETEQSENETENEDNVEENTDNLEDIWNDYLNEE